jgi:SAM-dependent methyltransferase
MTLLPDLATRRRQPELMDDPALAAPQLAAALRGIARLNRASNSARILWQPLAGLLRSAAGRPVRVLDIGTGSGDLPVALFERARRLGLPLHIDGCDVSGTAIDLARRRAAQVAAPLRFLQADALRDDIPDGYDVVMSSLFLHHLADEEAATLLGRMAAAARRLVLVQDLLRCRLGLLLAYAATSALSASTVVRTDGPRSVRGAFTAAEALALAERGGLRGARVERRWPCRYLLTWWKS